MTDTVILVRFDNGRVDFLSEEDGRMTVFPHRDAAIDCALSHPLCNALPYQVVELDEL